MDNASWFVLEPDHQSWDLPEDLRARDPFGGRDCGWVEQMRPFIRHFSSHGQRILDPFCGFGTTLLAAGLEGRRCIGFEIDPQRAELARERMRRHDVDADVRTGCLRSTVIDAPVNLCLTNVPYFGCNWPGTQLQNQLYTERNYADFLIGLRDVFHTVRCVLEDGAFCIAMAENLKIAGRRFPLAWDLARILDSLFVAHEERVLCYSVESSPLAHRGTVTNRSHEYALIYQKQRERVDLIGTLQVLQTLAAEGFVYRLYGSFAQWLDAGMPAEGRLPADADLLIPPQQESFDAVLSWLEDRGFELSVWGEAVAPPLPLRLLQERYYLRAQRRQNDGSLVRLDLSCGGSATGLASQDN